MKLHVIAAFDWAHAGIAVERFESGQEIETDDQDLIDVSEREGWTKREGARATASEAAPAPAAEPGAESDPVPDPVPDPEPAPDPTPAPAGGRKKK
ncbi:hypothetical protein [uncultured Massilia sp.]|uniref:hypothetical protein n=1 Tax=uncultured Massilia sp. TaxID=169973 RepID=UPI002589F44B|nr:hypothetical protein [uncultured Massilia sp.]